MTAVATTTLAPEVLEHLDEQLASTRRLLAAVLAQGKAIRARDVDRVLAGVSEIRTEMAVRAGMEDRRRTLLMRAGDALGISPAAVTLDAMTRLMDADEARTARVRSSELRGLLAEIGREHTVNRALMRQELAFLDHLVRVLGGEPQGAYSPTEPAGPAAPVHRALDLQA
jgi:hypothetical protein